MSVRPKDRQHYFGKIKNGVIGLSVPGCVAWHLWREIPDHQSNVILDEFVVMPDHLHGIVGIGLSQDNVGRSHSMSARNAAEEESKAKFGKPQSGSLSMIINHYKGAITRRCRQSNHEYFAWQSRFYDHIIRNEESLNRIQEYIYNNPLRWQIDQENMDGNQIHEKAVEYMVANY